MESIQMQPTGQMLQAYRTAMFDCATKGNWSCVKKLMDEKAQTCSDITSPSDIMSGKTLLHLACNTACRMAAKEAVVMILDKIEHFGIMYDDLKGFINSVDSNGQTAMHISLEKCRHEIIDILLENHGNLWIKFDSTFSHQYEKVLLKVLDSGIYLTRGREDELDKSQWTFSCNFSLITGEAEDDETLEENTVTTVTLTNPNDSLQTDDKHSSKEKVPETQLFAKILSLPEKKRYRILMHPLVQTFVNVKCHQYRAVIWASNVVHVIWYLLSAIVVTGTLTSILAINSKTIDGTEDSNLTNTWDYDNPSNITDYENLTRISDYENSTNTLAFNNAALNNTLSRNNKSSFTHNIGFISLICILVIGSFVKEIFQIIRSSTKIYHVTQVGKLSQYAVILATVVASAVGVSAVYLADWLKCIISIIYAVGILAALLLVQGEFSKLVLSGVNNHMMIKGFKRLLLFMGSFAVMFAAFGMYFHVLLPNDSSFSGPIVLPKLLAMQTGELNFNEIFTEENMKNKYFFIVPADIVFTVFIIGVVTLFPIILVGLAVENIKDLRNEATANCTASRLELASLLESTFVWIKKCLPKRNRNTVDNEAAVGSSIKNGSTPGRKKANVSQESPEGNEGLPIKFTYHMKFEKLPDDIKELIYTNKKIFPNGFDANCVQ